MSALGQKQTSRDLFDHLVGALGPLLRTRELRGAELPNIQWTKVPYTDWIDGVIPCAKQPELLHHQSHSRK
jgi:hypothetical protein